MWLTELEAPTIRLLVYILINVNVIYYVHVCEQAR